MKMTKLSLLLAALLVPGLLVAQSQVPDKISYQGYVTDAGGTPVGNTTPENRDVIFRVWSVASGGALAELVYSETQVVTVANGEFSVLVGTGADVTGSPLTFDESTKGPTAVNIADVFNGSDRYLGVTIDDGTAAADPEISPRQQIVSTAFAFRAKEAEMVTGGTFDGAITATGATFTGGSFTGGTYAGNGAGLSNLNGASLGTNSVSADKLAADIGVWEVSGSDIYRSSGNVGIGATSPDSSLTLTALGTSGSNGTRLIGFQEGNGGTSGFAISSGFEGSGDTNYLAISEGTPNSEIMTWTAGRNVGIGTSTPETRLHISKGASGAAYSASSSMVLENNTSHFLQLRIPNNYESGILFGTPGISADGGVVYKDSNSADHMNFRVGNNTSRMTILQNGNVGIGTTDPAEKLDVNGNIGLAFAGAAVAVADRTGSGWGGNLTLKAGGADNTTFANRGGNVVIEAGNGNSNNNDAIHGGGNVVLRSGTNTLGTVASNEFAAIMFETGVGTSHTERMRINQNGYVGIGTTTPSYPLDVKSSTGASGSFFYIDYPGGNLDGDYSNGTNVETVTIRAEQSVLAKQMVLRSDERIKNVIGRSDPVADLETLSKVEVTDYTMIDEVVHRGQPEKKVIAQQLEEIFPQAVSRGTDVIPDIYRKAFQKDGWIELRTDLKVGERVRLLTETGTDLYEVLEIGEGRFRTSLSAPDEEIFVYGREVNDFRMVDYDAISMLNVSTTQELHRMVQQKDSQIKALEERLAELEARDKTRDAKLTAIEELLRDGKKDQGVHTVSLQD